jgi:hypothetical protein
MDRDYGAMHNLCAGRLHANSWRLIQPCILKGFDASKVAQAAGPALSAHPRPHPRPLKSRGLEDSVSLGPAAPAQFHPTIETGQAVPLAKNAAKRLLNPASFHIWSASDGPLMAAGNAPNDLDHIQKAIVEVFGLREI